MTKKTIVERLEELWLDYASYVRYLENRVSDLEKELENYRLKKNKSAEKSNPDDYLERKFSMFNFFKSKN